MTEPLRAVEARATPLVLDTRLTIDQLCVSPLNVRSNREDATATETLEASILSEGLLQPLSVHRMRGHRRPGKELWGVFAGGRRYRSIRNLVERGELPADFAIAVQVHDAPDAEIVARSLAENMLRRDLRDYETFGAIARERKLGHTPEEIAARHGQSLPWVRRALRLGELAKPLFDAFEAGRISIEQAQAFGAVEDKALQEAAWAELGSASAHARTPAAIRAWYRIDDREAEKLLRFVGAEAYVAAGGWYERDLFDDGADGRGRVSDDLLLRRLADAKVAELRTDVRVRSGRPELRFEKQPPQGAYGGPDYKLNVTPEQRDDGTLVLPDGEIVAAIAIDDAGEPDVSWWWPNQKAMRSATPRADAAGGADRQPRRAAGALRPGVAINDSASPGAQRDADAAIKDEAGAARDSVQIMRTIRRETLRAALIDAARDGRSWGADYLVWAQLRIALGDEHSSEVGLFSIGQDRSAGASLGRDIVRDTPAHRIWSAAIEELSRTPLLNTADLTTSFCWYSTQNLRFKALAAAVVAGLALERSLNADGYDPSIHACLGAQLGLTDAAKLRRYWTPTEAFLGLLGSSQDRLAIAEPFVEGPVFAPWSRLKSAEITKHVLEVVTGRCASVRRSLVDAAARWVHPLLAFRVPDAGEAEPIDGLELEAAE